MQERPLDLAGRVSYSLTQISSASRRGITAGTLYNILITAAA